MRNPVLAKRALIEAAERIFNRDGYFATDSNAIAREAGYAPASFYTHFKDKLEIFLLVYERWVIGEWRAIENVVVNNGALQDWMGDVISVILLHHREWRIFRASLRAMAAIEPAVRSVQNRQRLRQIKWLQDICVARQLRKPDAATSASILLATERILDATAEEDVSALGVKPEQIRKALTKLMFLALGDSFPKGASIPHGRKR